MTSSFYVLILSVFLIILFLRTHYSYCGSCLGRARLFSPQTSQDNILLIAATLSATPGSIQMHITISFHFKMSSLPTVTLCVEDERKEKKRRGNIYQG